MKLNALRRSAIVIIAGAGAAVSGAVAADSAAFRVVGKAVVHEGDNSCGQPGVVRATNGDLLVTFYCGTNIEITRSTDNGATWQKPERVAEGAYTEVGITRLRDGTILWPFYEEFVKEPCCQVRRYGTYVYRSSDSGKSWQGDAPIQVEMREPIPYGRILELQDGRLLMPVWGAWRVGERWQVGTFESTDSGRTWKNYRQIAYDAKAGCRPDNGFNETSIAQLPDRTLVAILRQQRVGSAGGPCESYTEPADHFYRAISNDSGKTWTPPERLPLIGTSPALFVTPDGTFILGYRDNPQQEKDTEHYGLAVRVSRDKGLTWTNEVHLEDPKGLQYSRSQQPGYPDFIDLPNGDVLVVFHGVKLDPRTSRRLLYIASNVLRPAK
jgi:hypothetical protein